MKTFIWVVVTILFPPAGIIWWLAENFDNKKQSYHPHQQYIPNPDYVAPHQEEIKETEEDIPFITPEDLKEMAESNQDQD